MNVDYNVTDDVKVQGVYEVKTQEEGETENTNSLGVDLKFRLDF